jgi:hypothetical protein
VIAYGAASLLILAAGAALGGPAAGVAALAAIAFGIVVLRRPIVGAYALVACVPALSGLQRGFPVPGFRLTELMAVGIAALILVTAGRTKRWGAFDWIALSYVVANAGLVWLNVVRHGDGFTPDTLGTMLGPLQFLLLYRALLTAIDNSEQRARALRLLLLASIPVGILTLLQRYDVGGTHTLLLTLTGDAAAEAYRATADDLPRASGPFPYWHNLAGYLLLILLLVISLLHERSQRVMGKPALLAIFALGFVALVQTASIAPLLGLMLGSVLVARYVGQAKRMLAWVGIAAVLATAAFWSVLHGRFEEQYTASGTTEGQTLLPQTIAFRYEVWTTQFIPTIRDNLIVGYGPNLPPRLFFGYQESLYVTFLLRGGIVLLICYLALMGSLALRARRTAISADLERRTLGRAVFAAVILLLVIDTIATYFIDSGPAPLLWTLAGLMGADWARSRARWSQEGVEQATAIAPRARGSAG